MRKRLFSISVFIVCISCMTATFAEQAYSDEKCSEWAYYYIKDAESPLYNIMPSGMYGNDFTFSITRQEFCELIYNTVRYMNGVINASDKIGKTSSVYPTFSEKKSPFEDTNSECILTLYEVGIIKGKTKKTFCPSDYLSREETALIISRAAEYCNLKNLPYKVPFNDTHSLISEASDAIEAVCGMGIMNGTGENYFSPSKMLSKEQAIAIAMRLIDCIAHHSEINSELSCYFNPMQMWIEDKDGKVIFALPMYWATYNYRSEYGYSSWNFFKHNGKTVLAAFGSDIPHKDAHTIFYELPSGNKIFELPRKAGYFLNITKDEKYIITYDITKPTEFGSWGETVYGVYDFNGVEILSPIYSRDELYKAGYIDYDNK